MIDVEVLGAPAAPDAPSTREIDALCRASAARLGVADGHVAVEFADVERISELNLAHRGKSGPTDVLSFPIDGPGPAPAGGPPREIGDIVICPAHTVDLREAVVHGMLHLLGMDHESDGGEMLALQEEILAEAGR